MLCGFTTEGLGAMPDDILSIYAASQPDKPGVIDDRPDGTVVTWTYAELEAQSNRVANLLLCAGRRRRARTSCGAGRTHPTWWR